MIRLTAVLGVLAWVVSLFPAQAQVQLSIQTQRSTYLLFERVDVIVTLTNLTGGDLNLDNTDSEPWLSFLVSRHTHHNDVPIKTERNANFRGLTLHSGETKNLRINITPLFAFREVGEYRVAAAVNIPDRGQILSEQTPFSVLNGTTVWSQLHPVGDSTRAYSLIRFSPDSNHTNLYLRVEDEAKNIVYANVGLGEVVSYVDPDIYFDPAGNVHVLHPIAASTYLYSRANADGQVEHQGIFRTLREVPPRLRKLTDGNVIVQGGLEQNPNTPREVLSQGQVANSAPNPDRSSRTTTPPSPLEPINSPDNVANGTGPRAAAH